MAQPQKLIVGLGNPGSDYMFTRHNIGFMVLDTLAPSTSWQKKFCGEIQHADIADTPCLLLKPLTFMNLSGEAVGEALRFYKLAPENVIVFHDDIDLLPNKIKVKQGGGHAGHNGLKSIDAHIGPDYWRVRIGVGHPGNRDQVSNHVLSAFDKSDKVWLEKLLANIAQNFPLALKDNWTEFTDKSTS